MPKSIAEVEEDVIVDEVEKVLDEVPDKETEETTEDLSEYKEPIQEPEDTVDGKTQPKEPEVNDSQKLIDDLVNRLAPKKEDEPQYPWEKEGRAPTWKEALDYTAKQAKEELRKEQDERVRIEQEKAQAQEQAQTEYTKRLQSVWADQLTDLTRQGLIPPIKNVEDDNDPGKKARLELFKIAQQHQAIDQGNLTAAYWRMSQAQKTTEAQTQAPVAGNMQGGQSAPSKEWSYAELQKYRSIDEIEE
jgi:glutamyl-tRNA reductase